MASIPRGVLRQMAGGGDRPKDRWEPNEKKDKEVFDVDDRVQEHHDRLAVVEERLGIKRKADNMKGEDQGGKSKPVNAGHVSMRKRH